MSMTHTGAPRGFVLKGSHVLLITLAFFGVIFAVNGLMIYYAIGSFPGAVTDSSYKASQTYNKEVAAAEAQAALGWSVATHAERAADGHVSITLEARDKTGAPLAEIGFKATLQHPANRALDRTVELATVLGTSGRYAGVLDGIAAGQWHLVVEADGREGRLWLSENRLILR